MKEVTDYSGPLISDLKWEDFSKDFLVKLMRSWQYAYMEQAEIYDKVISARYGNEATVSINQEVWDKIPRRIGPRLAKLGNIQVNTVCDIIKIVQLYPDSFTSPMYSGKFEIVNDNHAIVTVTKCRTLEYYERERPDLIDTICHHGEARIMQSYCIDPRARVTARHLPPLDPSKRNKAEPTCSFDYRLVK